MGKQEFPFVSHFKDRHGKLRWRFRKDGLDVALGTDYGSPEFLRKLSAAQKGERLLAPEATRSVRSGSVPGSLSDVIEGWYKSPDYMRLGQTTKYGYRQIAEKLRETYGNNNLAQMQRRHIKDIMATKADFPAAANHILSIFRMVLRYAVEAGTIPTNPSLGIQKYNVPGDGFHTWTEAEIQAFYDVHPKGSVAYTAITLMLYTGAAKADAALLGWHSVKDNRLQYRRKKMQTRAGVLVDIPLHPVLAECLASLPKEHTTFLQTQAGFARSANGLGKMMREWCSTAGLPECSSHGLRKACARRIIEAGGTPHQLMAVTGHKTLAEAEKYAAAFDRTQAADAAFGLMSLTNPK